MGKTLVILVIPFDCEPNMWSNEIFSGPLYLASFLKARLGEEVDIAFLDLKVDVGKKHAFESPRSGQWDVFLQAMEHAVNEIMNEKIGGEPGAVIIGISCLTSEHYPSTLFISLALRTIQPSATIVVGGYHPSICVDDFLSYGQLFDYIVLGEGEVAFAEIVSKTNGHRSHFTQPRIVKGKPVANLEELPEMEFSVFSDYLAFYPSLNLNLSRGCGGRCAFCLEREVHSQIWRAYPPDRALREIENMVEVGKQYNMKFGFYDPNFAQDKAWRTKVLEGIISRDMGVEFWGEARFDTLSHSDLDLFARANVHLLFGLESGSPTVLTTMHKTANPTKYLNHFREIVEWSAELAYPCVMNILFNHPGETFATMQESQEFFLDALHTSPYLLDSSALYRHYPGSYVYTHAEQYAQELGSLFCGGRWWHLLRDQRKGGRLNRASKDLPIRVAFETYYTFEIERVKVQMENAKNLGKYDFQTMVQIKAIIEKAQTELRALERLSEPVNLNPPHIPEPLWGELEEIMREGGQYLTGSMQDKFLPIMTTKS